MSIFHQIIELILLRRSVSELTHLPIALYICMLACVLNVTILGIYNPIITTPFAFALIKVSSYAVLLYFILQLHKITPRFVQTGIALFGTLAITDAFLLIAVFLPQLGFFALAVSLWSLVIQIKILQQTLESGAGRAVLLTLLYITASSIILMFFFPDILQSINEILQNQQKITQSATQ